jgi:hypothetical protein
MLPSQGPSAVTAVMPTYQAFPGVTVVYGPGFGCAVAATIFQAIALGLTVKAALAPAQVVPPPVAKTDAPAAQAPAAQAPAAQAPAAQAETA